MCCTHYWGYTDTHVWAQNDWIKTRAELDPIQSAICDLGGKFTDTLNRVQKGALN